jgi:hypothetical protein
MAGNLEIITEFQYRRKATGKAILPWLVVTSIASLSAFLIGDERAITPNRFLVCIYMSVLAGVAFVRIIYIVREKYRCPHCDEIPMSSGISIGSGFSFDEGVALYPKRCSHCGTELR